MRALLLAALLLACSSTDRPGPAHQLTEDAGVESATDSDGHTSSGGSPSTGGRDNTGGSGDTPDAATGGVTDAGTDAPEHDADAVNDAAATDGCFNEGAYICHEEAAVLLELGEACQDDNECASGCCVVECSDPVACL